MPRTAHIASTPSSSRFPLYSCSLASCGGSGPGTGPDPSVVTVMVTPNVLTVMVVGSEELTARDRAGRALIGSAVTRAISATAVASRAPESSTAGAPTAPDNSESTPGQRR